MLRVSFGVVLCGMPDSNNLFGDKPTFLKFQAGILLVDAVAQEMPAWNRNPGQHLQNHLPAPAMEPHPLYRPPTENRGSPGCTRHLPSVEQHPVRLSAGQSGAPAHPVPPGYPRWFVQPQGVIPGQESDL